MNFLTRSLVSKTFFLYYLYILMLLIKSNAALLQVMFLHLENLDLWP
jgi:hypothetical protein